MLCLGVLCAQGFASNMTDRAIHTSNELFYFAAVMSSKIQAANKIYGKELKEQNLKETQNKKDEICINVKNDPIVDSNTFRDFAFKTIPNVIAAGGIKKGQISIR